MSRSTSSSSIWGTEGSRGRIQMVQGWNISRIIQPAEHVVLCVRQFYWELSFRLKFSRLEIIARPPLKKFHVNTLCIASSTSLALELLLQYEYKNGIILDSLFFWDQNRTISISERRSRCFKSSTQDIHPGSVISDLGLTS